MPNFWLFVLCRRGVVLGLFGVAFAWGVASAPAATGGPRSPAIIGNAGHRPSLEESRRVSRAIAAIDARLQRCYAENKPTGPPEVAACNEKATGSFEALLRPSRQKEFEAFLEDLFPPFYHFLTKDGAGQSSMEGVVIATFRDLARRRAAILGGADKRSPHPRLGRLSLSRLLSRFHGDPLLYQHGYGRHLLRHWTKVRNGDCAAHPVPHCAERLDAAFADVLDSTLNDK